MARDVSRELWPIEQEELRASVLCHPTVTDDIARLVALGCNGGRFAAHAASSLLSLTSLYSEVRYWLLVSALNRGDAAGATRFLRDWKGQDMLPAKQVHKFVPGDHYYALDKKFDSLEEAQNHLRANGYRYGGLSERFVYPNNGG